MSEFRFVIRQLARTPRFTALAVVTIALGVGACTAIFSVVNSVLLRSLPLPEPERVVVVRERLLPEITDADATTGQFLRWQSENVSFQSLGALTSATFNLTGYGEPVRVTAMRMTATLLSTFGVAPVIGRNFRPEEDRPGDDGVVILSYGLWQRRFGGSSDVLEKTVQLNGRSYVVVGVMPRASPLPERIELFAPFAPAEHSRHDFGSHITEVYGRLKPGMSLIQAESELQLILERAARQHPQARGWRVKLVPLAEAVAGPVRPVLLSLVGAVMLLLLIACANVANLLLARASGRASELAVRAAIGASRLRIIRQLLLESLTLAVAGGLLGVVIADTGLRALLSVAPTALPRTSEISVDGPALLFCVALTMFTGVAFGLAPAFQVSRVRLNEVLKQNARGNSEGLRARRFRAVLVAGEVAVALVLLTGATLLMRSFTLLHRESPGYRAEGAWAAHVHLPRPKYSQVAQYLTFADQVAAQLEQIPGVQMVATSVQLPFTEYAETRGFSIMGRPERDRATPVARFHSVSPSYFPLMEIPLRRGRLFTAADHRNAPLVAIVNDSFVRAFLGGQEPLGQRLSIIRGDERPREIVGVVGDVKTDKLDGGSPPQMFVPFVVAPDNDIFFLLRTAGPVGGLPNAIRAAVLGLDPEQPVHNLRPLTEFLAEAIGRQELAMTLFAVFAVVAVVLAAIGIYGVMAYSVSRRTGEIGIRMALGAQTGDVLRLVGGQGARMVALGLGLGLAGALFLTGFLESLLFQVSARDPAIFAVVGILLAGIAALACVLPARRAARVSPMVALRGD